MYLCIVLGRYLCILGAPSVQSSCALSISASYRVFLWQISQIQTCLCVVVGHGFVSTLPAFMRSRARVRMAGLPKKNCKSVREFSTQFAQQLVTAVTAPSLVGFNQNKSSGRTIAVALEMSKAFGTVNIHTLTSHIYDTEQTSHIPFTNSLQTISKDAKHTLGSETKHRHNANSKLVFQRRRSITDIIKHIQRECRSGYGRT